VNRFYSDSTGQIFVNGALAGVQQDHQSILSSHVSGVVNPDLSAVITNTHPDASQAITTFGAPPQALGALDAVMYLGNANASIGSHYFDNLTVTPIPEPGTFACMALTLGALVTAMRLRKPSPNTPAHLIRRLPAICQCDCSRFHLQWGRCPLWESAAVEILRKYGWLGNFRNTPCRQRASWIVFVVNVGRGQYPSNGGRDKYFGSSQKFFVQSSLVGLFPSSVRCMGPCPCCFNHSKPVRRASEVEWTVLAAF
jgi:hypothetical protein